MILAPGCTYNVSMASDAPISATGCLYAAEGFPSLDGRVKERCSCVGGGADVVVFVVAWAACATGVDGLDIKGIMLIADYTEM